MCQISSKLNTIQQDIASAILPERKPLAYEEVRMLWGYEDCPRSKVGWSFVISLFKYIYLSAIWPQVVLGLFNLVVIMQLWCFVFGMAKNVHQLDFKAVLWIP
jgi:hypothetical protein